LNHEVLVLENRRHLKAIQPFIEYFFMLDSIKKPLRFIKYEIRDNIDALKGKPKKGHGELSRRIKLRHLTFWKQADSEIVRNTIMQSSDPIEKWKDAENWQRKLSNKQNAREFAKMFGCRVPDLYWSGRDIGNLDFTNLPKQFVIRPTIGYSCQLVCLMNDGYDMMNNCYYSNNDLQELMRRALETNPYQEFLIEEFLKDEDGNYRIPDDYKIFMFNGELAVIELINRVKPKYGFERAYDENWNMIFDIATDFPRAEYQNPPKCLPQIIADAKKLSKAYEIFVRIDFYATDKGAVFGEFTPTPDFGNYFTPKADKMFIDYWDRYCKGKI
jgi:hypothetical protein